MFDRRGFIAAAGAATAIASTRLSAQAVADDRIYGYPGTTRPFGPDVYRERRAKLLAQMKDGVAVIYGPREIDLGSNTAPIDGAASDFFRASHPDHSLQIALYTLLPFYGLAVLMFVGLARTIRKQAAKEALS